MDRLWTGYVFGAASCGAVLVGADMSGMPMWQAVLGYIILTPVGMWIAVKSN